MLLDETAGRRRAGWPRRDPASCRSTRRRQRSPASRLSTLSLTSHASSEPEHRPGSPVRRAAIGSRRDGLRRKRQGRRDGRDLCNLEQRRPHLPALGSGPGHQPHGPAPRARHHGVLVHGWGSAGQCHRERASPPMRIRLRPPGACRGASSARRLGRPPSEAHALRGARPPRRESPASEARAPTAAVALS